MQMKIFAFAMAVLISLAGPMDLLAQKAKTPAKAPAKAAVKKKVVSSSKKVPARRKAVRSRRVVAKRAPAPVNQRVPTKDRYAEIQQALVDAGYFTGDADGVWKDDSIEALKSFQDANGFDPTGKVDARSLIKLGLGPNYEASAGTSTTPVQGANGLPNGKQLPTPVANPDGQPDGQNDARQPG
jgi:hypothetical protein